MVWPKTSNSNEVEHGCKIPRPPDPNPNPDVTENNVDGVGLGYSSMA
jgi:hypothetical protein